MVRGARGDAPGQVRGGGCRDASRDRVAPDLVPRLVAKVLELARLERAGGAAAASARHVPLGLAALAREVVAGFEPLAREKGFALALRAPEGGGPGARGDRGALSSALLNLLDNAVKHAGRPHEIEIEVDRAPPGRATVAVLDRGRGVPPRDAERIFEPFARDGEAALRLLRARSPGLVLLDVMLPRRSGAWAISSPFPRSSRSPPGPTTSGTPPPTSKRSPSATRRGSRRRSSGSCSRAAIPHRKRRKRSG